MAPQSVVLDIANNAAAIPGDGENPVVFTHSFDVADYVSRLLDLPKWDEESYIVGDKLTFNEFVKLAEEIKGSFYTRQLYPRNKYSCSMVFLRLQIPRDL